MGKLELGRLVITAAAKDTLPEYDIFIALERHKFMDWGDICSEDWKVNDEAVKNGERVLSVYKSYTEKTFWIITEWDRSATTILLTSDY